MSEVTSSAPVGAAPEGQSQESPEAQGDQKKSIEALPASMKKKFQLKVDGEDIEEEVDFSDEEGMKSRLQLARAAKKRMAEAREEKKKAFEIVSAFENNPESMLARLGPKGREIAEKFLLNQIQDEMLSPEEREFRQTKKERDELKAEKEAALKKQQDEAREREEFQYAQTFQKTIIDALDQSGMPKTALNVRRLADLMSKNLELGLDLSPKELAEEWAKERASNNQAEIKEMTAEQFIKLYGADMAKKLRLHSLKELQEKQGMVFQGGKKIESSGPKVTESRPTSLEEYMEAARKRARG